MGSVVRAVASDLDPAAAAELRDELVRNAPEGMREVDEASLSARHCFLAEVPANPVRMSFAEWVKTREEGELGGMGGFFGLRSLASVAGSVSQACCGVREGQSVGGQGIGVVRLVWVHSLSIQTGDCVS